MARERLIARMDSKTGKPIKEKSSGIRYSKRALERYDRRERRYRGGGMSPFECLAMMNELYDPKGLGSEVVRQLMNIDERIKKGEKKEDIIIELEAKRTGFADPDSIEIVDLVISRLKESR